MIEKCCWARSNKKNHVVVVIVDVALFVVELLGVPLFFLSDAELFSGATDEIGDAFEFACDVTVTGRGRMQPDLLFWVSLDCCCCKTE